MLNQADFLRSQKTHADPTRLIFQDGQSKLVPIENLRMLSQPIQLKHFNLKPEFEAQFKPKPNLRLNSLINVKNFFFSFCNFAMPAFFQT